MSKTRVAVIGAGWWGYEHLRVFTANANSEVCALLTRGAERGKQRAAEFHVPLYTDLEKMLEQEKPDLVSICLPNQQHFEVTMAVIRAGYPLLVEKPLVFEPAQATALVEAAAAKKLFFAINFNHRYARPIAMGKAAIEAGRLGEITFATWRFGGEGGADHPFNNLIETQCHGFDALEHLCGPIRSVMAQMTDKTRPGFFTTMAIALQFASGAVGAIIGSYDSSYAYPNTHMMEINGTKGRVWIEDTVRRYTFHAAGSETGETWQAGYFNDRDRTFVQTFDTYAAAMLKALRDGKPPPVHATAGVRALNLAKATEESFRQGKRVETLEL